MQFSVDACGWIALAIKVRYAIGLMEEGLSWGRWLGGCIEWRQYGLPRYCNKVLAS
jgi:hypothetical protein